MSEVLHKLSPDPKPAAAPGLALWNLGFRPFYLLASAFAALSVLLWVAQYTGLLPLAYVNGPAWHGHEMLFGYTTAVIAGFLLTAVPNWTGQPTPKGGALAALAGLWIAGRVLVLTPFATLSMLVECRVSGGDRHRHRHPAVAQRQPPQLFFRRAARGDGGRHPRRAPLRKRHVRAAAARGIAGRARHRALRHGRDGRARDPDVHQQRRARAPAPRAIPGSRGSRSASLLALLLADILRIGASAGDRPRRCGCRAPGAPAALAAVAHAGQPAGLDPSRGLCVDRRVSLLCGCRPVGDW